MQRESAEHLFDELKQRLACAGDEPLYLILAVCEQ